MFFFYFNGIPILMNILAMMKLKKKIELILKYNFCFIAPFHVESKNNQWGSTVEEFSNIRFRWKRC